MSFNPGQKLINADPVSTISQRRSISHTLGKGLLLALPLLIFCSLVYLGIKLLLSFVAPLTLLLASGAEVPPWYLHILSLFIVIGLLYLVGLIPKFELANTWAGRIKVKYLMHLPFYRQIDDMVQQFSGIKKMPFSQVVLVDPFGNGVLLTGFVSEEVNPNLFTVFVPTAPNPLNGNIYHVPKSKLTFLPISPDVAMRTIVGMGNGSTFLFPHLDTNEKEQTKIARLSA
ncbi:MAG: DUF502 domain-containing protein [Saprospiraceae bacterium]|nr:DUF502 domain-containing protein [Saprospiraceae bacterium]